MTVVLFTKMFASATPEELVGLVLELGLSGVDLAVREGHYVNPENLRRALPEMAEVIRAHGLRVELVTTETVLIDPRDPVVRPLWRGCGEQGIGNVKIGYWRWDETKRHRDQVDAIRGALEGFEALGREFGVRTLLHTHSGGSYGSNCSGLADLLKGFDPQFVGAYVDPAHLALGGEPLRMALDIVRDWLAMVAVKNARRLPARDRDTMVWKADWCLLREGFVDWRAAVGDLRAAGYEGALSLHGEYSGLEETAQVRRRLAEDASYLRSALEALDAPQ